LSATPSHGAVTALLAPKRERSSPLGCAGRGGSAHVIGPELDELWDRAIRANEEAQKLVVDFHLIMSLRLVSHSCRRSSSIQCTVNQMEGLPREGFIQSQPEGRGPSRKAGCIASGRSKPAPPLPPSNRSARYHRRCATALTYHATVTTFDSRRSAINLSFTPNFPARLQIGR